MAPINGELPPAWADMGELNGQEAMSRLANMIWFSTENLFNLLFSRENIF